MHPILDIRHLTTRLPTRRGTLTVVDDVSFTLRAGECFGIVGESGSGKSMTCRSILGLVPRVGRAAAGEIGYGGRNLRTLSEPELNRIRGADIAMIVQDAITALNPVRRIGEQITEAMIDHGLARRGADARQKALELMRKVGIPDPEARLDDYPHQFSGGMCQRVVIATALAGSPRVLLADEPTTALDVTIQHQILKLLSQLQADLQLSLVLVTHDMGVVAQTCQRVAVMYGGQIVELAETAALFRSPRHPYTAGLLDCVPRAGAAIGRLRPIQGMPPDLLAPPPGCRFAPRCRLAGPECRTGAFPLREVAPGHFSACIRHGQLQHPGTTASAAGSGGKAVAPSAASAPEARMPPLLDVRGLSKIYVGANGLLDRLARRPAVRLVAVNDVSFTVEAGEILGVVGESGSGKTTLGRTLLRLLEPTAGEVRYGGVDLLALPHGRMRAARRRMQMIFQDPYSSLNPRLTVRAMLSEALRFHKVVPRAQVETRVIELLELVGLPADAIDRHPRHFSGGQRQRLGIARALAVEPKFIVADEPLSAVDVSVQAQIMNLLLELRERLGLTLLFITHDLSVVRYVSTRVAVMYLGRIVEIAPTATLFREARHPYTQGLLLAAPNLDPEAGSATVAMRGEPPSPLRPPSGCAFHARCHLATGICRTSPPPLQYRSGSHGIACHHHEKAARSATVPEIVPLNPVERIPNGT